MTWNEFRAKYNPVNVVFFSALPIVSLVGIGFYAKYVGVSAVAIALFFGMMIATLMAITAGYHRLFAHRSYDGANWLKLVLLLFGAGAFQESCLKWSSEHRIHHKYVDTDRDPYNIKKGFFWAHIGWILSSKDANAPQPQDLKEDPLVMWQHKYWLPLAIIMSFGFPTFVGALFGDALGGLLFGGFLRLTIAHHLTFFINSYAHTIGTQPYTDDNTARDSWTTAIFTFGEGYHNFHHWYARDYRNGIRFYHWDPGKWFIWFMNKLGQAKNLKRAPDEVILRAKLKMERHRAIQDLDPTTMEKAEKMFGNLMNHLDEFGQRRKAWIEAKKAHAGERIKDLTVMKERFKEARAAYFEAHKSWRTFLRQKAELSFN